MAKSGELAYFELIGEEGRQASIAKPFSIGQAASAGTCGDYLLAFGGLATLLHPTPSRLLDLGCGTGWTSCFFAKMGYRVLGQDISSQAIALAQQFAAVERVENVSFLASDYELLDFDGQFDNAVFFDSLHHSIDERLALESAYRALRPGGVCVTREPGVGHAQAPHSVHAVECFGVTERDMPPARIADAAFQIGFRQVNVFPFPDDLFRGQTQVRSSRTSLPWGGLRSWWQRVRGAYSAGRRAASLHWRMRNSGGLVQLVK